MLSPRGRPKDRAALEKPWEDRERGLEMPTGGFRRRDHQDAHRPPDGSGRLHSLALRLRGDRLQEPKPWELHLDWLSAFRCWLSAFRRTAHATASRGTVVLGDFNQWIPRAGSWPTKEPAAALCQTFQGLCISTHGKLPWKAGDARGAGPPNKCKDQWEATLDLDPEGPEAGGNDQLIDHIAHTPDLALARTETRNGADRTVGIFPRRTPDKPLSDHYGVWADFTAK